MDRESVALRLYYVAVFSALGVFVPFFPTWLEAQGVRGFELGVATAISPIAGLFGPLLFGYLADRFSLRASLVRIACVFGAGSMGVVALLGSGSGLSLAPLVMLVGIYALFRAALIMVADVSAMESHISYGRLRLWGSIGFLLGAVFAGQVLDLRSPTHFPLFMVSAVSVALLVSLAMPVAGPRPPAPMLDGVKKLARAQHFRVFLLLTVLWVASHSGHDLIIGRYLVTLGGTDAHVGVAWGIGVGSEIMLMAWSPSLFRRFTPQGLLICALLVCALRWLLLAGSPSLYWAIACQPLHAVTFGLMWLAALSFIKEHAPAGVQATAQGAFNAAAAFGGGGAALMWGPMYETYGGRTVLLIAAGIAGAACLVGWRLFTMLRAESGPLQLAGRA